MKKISKSTFFIVVCLIALFTASSALGLDYFYGDKNFAVLQENLLRFFEFNAEADMIKQSILNV